MGAIPQNFLMNLRFPCRAIPDGFDPSRLSPEALGATHRTPCWSRRARAASEKIAEETAPTSRNSSNESLFDFRIGWSNAGLLMTTVVDGKSEQRIFTRARLDEADELIVCLDARDFKESHRASRFCSKFAFYPLIGEKGAQGAPMAERRPLSRAKGAPSPFDPNEIAMASERRARGCAFSAFIPSEALAGFDPTEFNRFGLHFRLRDAELGDFVLQLDAPFPVEDDPSLWASFVMLGAPIPQD